MLLDCPEESGMRLTIDGADVELPLRRFLDFKGESVTTGTLLGAPVRDFNVMSRRARVRHACGYAALDSGRALETVDGDWLFAYVVAGLVMLRGDDVGSRALSAGESVLCEGANAVEVLSGREGCQLVWAAFHSIARA
jgi:environmental stress-induced protein Ves